MLKPILNNMKIQSLNWTILENIPADDKKEKYDRTLDFIIDIIEELVEFTRHQANVEELTHLISTIE